MYYVKKGHYAKLKHWLCMVSFFCALRSENSENRAVT